MYRNSKPKSKIVPSVLKAFLSFQYGTKHFSPSPPAKLGKMPIRFGALAFDNCVL